MPEPHLLHVLVDAQAPAGRTMTDHSADYVADSTCYFEWPAVSGQLHIGRHLCFLDGQHDGHVCSCGARTDGSS